MEKSALKAAIWAAFDDVSYPGDDNIGILGGRDDAKRVTEWYRGVDWRSLTPDTIWSFGLSWMTPEAFHYYLPAYLLAPIDDGADAYEFTLNSLTPPFACTDYPQNYKDHFQNIVDIMTLPQKRAIQDFLLFNLEEAIELQKTDESPDFYDSEIKQLRFALEYWGQALKDER
ncbi:hypothetical protein IAD21_01538 [Abditibacteriota bacterium]|nr:hypothetical protein IAD21_01538 [Abditibacteriota bacterium]